MPTPKEAAETLSRCPRCEEQLLTSPDVHCPLCEGSGLVSVKTAQFWKRQESAKVPIQR